MISIPSARRSKFEGLKHGKIEQTEHNNPQKEVRPRVPRLDSAVVPNVGSIHGMIRHVEQACCLLCSSNDYDPVASTGAHMMIDAQEVFHFVRSRRCGLVYLNPRVEPHELWRYYPWYYLPYRGPNAWGRFAHIASWGECITDARRRRVASRVFRAATRQRMAGGKPHASWNAGHIRAVVDERDGASGHRLVPIDGTAACALHDRPHPDKPVHSAYPLCARRSSAGDGVSANSVTPHPCRSGKCDHAPIVAKGAKRANISSEYQFRECVR